MRKLIGVLIAIVSLCFIIGTFAAALHIPESGSSISTPSGLVPPLISSNIINQQGAIGPQTQFVNILPPPVQVTDSCSLCNGATNMSSEPVQMELGADTISKSAELAQIQSINKEIKENGMEWTAGETSVSQLTHEAFQRHVGTDVSTMGHDPAHEKTLSQTVNEQRELTSLPTAFSWRNVGGKNYTTPVRNQKACGSCWAFAITAMFESWREMYAKKSTWNPDFAEQYLLSCNRYGSSCAGGSWYSLNHLISTRDVKGSIGTVAEGKYPYTAKKTTCKSLSGYSRYKLPATVGGVRPTWYYYSGLQSTALLKELVYGYGPIIVAIKADDSYFRSYKSGIFDNPRRLSGTDHAVLLVGWGVKNGRTYWIIKNSWGPYWGENGWMRIYAGENNVGTQPAYFAPGPWYRGASLNTFSQALLPGAGA